MFSVLFQGERSEDLSHSAIFLMSPPRFFSLNHYIAPYFLDGWVNIKHKIAFLHKSFLKLWKSIPEMDPFSVYLLGNS